MTDPWKPDQPERNFDPGQGGQAGGDGDQRYGQQPQSQQPGPYGQPNPYAPPQYGVPQSGAPYGPRTSPYGPPYEFGPPLSRRRRRLVLFVVLGAVVALLTTCGISGYAFCRSQVKVNVDAVNAFLDAMRDGDYDAAYDRLCADEQHKGSADDFADAARQTGRNVASHDISGLKANNRNGVTRRTVGSRVRFTDGTVRAETFALLKENGKVCITSGYADLLSG